VVSWSIAQPAFPTSWGVMAYLSKRKRFMMFYKPLKHTEVKISHSETLTAKVILKIMKFFIKK